MTQTTVDTDLFHYVGILEAVVAVLAVKSGLNPETMMGQAIEQITEQLGMETLDTERLIRERWRGRDLQVIKLAAQVTPDTLAQPAVVAPGTEEQEPPVPLDMKDRYTSYKERLQMAVDLGIRENVEYHTDATDS